MSADVSSTRAPFNWPAVFMFLITTVPVVTVFPWYAWKFGFDTFEWTWFLVLWALPACPSPPVITACGRIAATRRPCRCRFSTCCSAPWRCRTASWCGRPCIASIIATSTTSISDPYSAKRGLWFSHIGWMLRNYPSGEHDLRNAKDLEANPIVRFQHKYYLWLRIGMNVGVPLLLGWMHGDIWGSLMLGGLLRLVVSHHCTFFINSLAHFWGSRPYTTENTARDNGVLALFT